MGMYCGYKESNWLSWDIKECDRLLVACIVAIRKVTDC